MISILYFLIALITLSYVWIKRRYSFWTRKNVLQGAVNFPYGSMKGIGSTAASFEILDKYYKEFKGRTQFIGMYAFFTPNLLIIDPNLVKEILIKEFPSFNHRGMYHNKVNDPASLK